MWELVRAVNALFHSVMILDPATAYFIKTYKMEKEKFLNQDLMMTWSIHPLAVA